MKLLWEEVKLTDIQISANEETELTLCTNVIPYPGNIYSIWVFFGVQLRG
jgi:hypothetical protein